MSWPIDVPNGVTSSPSVVRTAPPHLTTAAAPNIPRPQQECHFLGLPGEVIMKIIWLGDDIDSIGLLAFTCHTLFSQIFVQAPLPAHLLSKIVSRLLYLQDLPALTCFCNQIHYAEKPVLDLEISRAWKHLDDVLK